MFNVEKMKTMRLCINKVVRSNSANVVECSPLQNDLDNGESLQNYLANGESHIKCDSSEVFSDVPQGECGSFEVSQGASQCSKDSSVPCNFATPVGRHRFKGSAGRYVTNKSHRVPRSPRCPGRRSDVIKAKVANKSEKAADKRTYECLTSKPLPSHPQEVMSRISAALSSALSSFGPMLRPRKCTDSVDISILNSEAIDPPPSPPPPSPPPPSPPPPKRRRYLVDILVSDAASFNPTSTKRNQPQPPATPPPSSRGRNPFITSLLKL